MADQSSTQEPDKPQAEASGEESTPAPIQPVWCEVVLTASSRQDTVIFNEIAWMGTADSAQNEWIELKNISANQINLHGWQLFDKKKDIAIAFAKEHSISPQSFFILERRDDTTLSNIIADGMYTGSLNNIDEALYLFDSACVLQDSVFARSGWPAGDSAERRSMERSQDLSWHTYEGTIVDGIFGTPNEENGMPTTQENTLPEEEQSISPSSFEPYFPPDGGEQEQTPPSEESEPVTYPKILISEIQAEGETAKDEFVELYNPNNTSVDLLGWNLKKKTSNGSESNLVSSGKFSGQIAAFGYFLIAPQINEDGTPNYKGLGLPDLRYSGKTYSFAKNNTILLYDPSGELVDKVGFGEAQDFEGSAALAATVGKSLGRKFTEGRYQDTDDNFNDFEIQTPTPKAQNQKAPEQEPVSEEELISPPDTSQNEEESPPNGREGGEQPAQTLVLINEIAWMGTKASFNDEWIEIFNTGPKNVDLTGWQLLADDNMPSIELSGTISAGGYYLLERTDDTTISNISADLIYTGALNNGGETLRLYNASGKEIDVVDTSSGWFAGDNVEKISMERIDPENSGSDVNNWASNNLFKQNGQDADNFLIHGTPGQENSVAVQ